MDLALNSKISLNIRRCIVKANGNNDVILLNFIVCLKSHYHKDIHLKTTINFAWKTGQIENGTQLAT